MNAISTDLINLSSPYKVTQVSKEDFCFDTDFDVRYKIGFVEDFSIWEEGAYQFYIINSNNKPSPRDLKVKLTILSCINAFFAANPSILLYICETGDDKQSARNRLFCTWLNEPACKKLYYFENAHIIAEGQDNYMAVIVQLNNPLLPQIIKDFEEFAELMQDKPE